METQTEKKVRQLQAKIKQATSPVVRKELKSRLKDMVHALAVRHEREQIRRFTGNEF